MFFEFKRSFGMLSVIIGLSLGTSFIAEVSAAEVLAAQTEISGHYLEARSCQVYTGPCFANAETGLAGKEAVMAWKINEGQHEGVDLTGLSVVMAVHGSDTFGFHGLNDPKELKSIIIVDDKATDRQRTALISFVRRYSGKAGQAVVRVTSEPIDMTLNDQDLKGKLKVGNTMRLETRKAGLSDCICSNESAYYPPLAQVQYSAPGVSTVGEFKCRGLGVQWSCPGDRNTYMATFAY
jgi:hypothetical protein